MADALARGDAARQTRYRLRVRDGVHAIGGLDHCPSLLGSPGTRWFTEIIQQWFFEGQDWNQGSAYAFLLLILCTGFVMLMMRLLRVRLADIAK